MLRINWFGWLSGFVVIGLIYHAVIIRLVGSEWRRTDFDYCYLIPVVMMYLVWERRDELQRTLSTGSWWSLIAFFFAGVLYLLGELGGEFLSLYLSFWFAIFGLCWSLLGWKKTRIVLFPIVLLLTAFPPPNYIYSRLTMGMQLLSTKIGVFFLHQVGVPAYAEGNVIDLGFMQMEVVAACSGLRFLIPLIIVGMILTYYFRDQWWRRALLLLSTLPVAIIMNGLRIGVTGILAGSFGDAVADGSAHDIMGWIMFVISTAILIGCMHLLSSRKRAPVQTVEISAGRPVLFKFAPVLIGLGLLAAAYGLAQYRSAAPLLRPTSAPLASFPTQFQGWEGRFVSIESAILKELDLSDYVQIDYRDPQGRIVDFYVAWYDSQRKGESIHSPETCLRGGGWRFRTSGAAMIDVPGFKSVRVNRAILEQNGQLMVSYFWFPVRGSHLVNGVELKLHTFWGSLISQRTDGGLVRLITPVYPNELEADADRRLQALMSNVLPVLERLLPGAEEHHE